MAIPPLRPLPPLNPPKAGAKAGAKPAVYDVGDLLFGSGGDYGGFFGSDQSGGDYGGYIDPYGFLPVYGPTLGGNFPCDPSIDPFCGLDSGGGSIGGGDSGGGGIIFTSGHSGTGGTVSISNAPSAPGKCSLFPLNLGPCLERLAVFLLGLIAIIGAIYLFKPSIITGPIKEVRKTAQSAAVVAAAAA